MFSGAVVVRNRVAHWRTVKMRAPILKAKAILKRLTENMANSKKVNLHTVAPLKFQTLFLELTHQT
jgi:hypothetical protein